MVGPFKNKNVRVVVDDTIISVAELTNIELLRNAIIESKYGMKGIHSDRRHAVGKKKVPFTIRRWFKTGTGQTLFYSLHENGTLFNIEQFVNVPCINPSEIGGLIIIDCKSYSYRLISGNVNDIIAEEISGYGLAWIKKTQIQIEEIGEMFGGSGYWGDPFIYFAPFGLASTQEACIYGFAEEYYAQVVMPFNGKLKNLFGYMKWWGALGAGSTTLTIRKKGDDTTLLLTLSHPDIPDEETYETNDSNEEDEVEFSKGDKICIKLSGDVAWFNWGCEIVKT